MADTDTRLANRILIGLGLGVLAGTLTLLAGQLAPGVLEGARALATNVLDPLGQVFLRLLFFVVLPLVFASLAAGVLHLGDLSKLGPLSARTFALFFTNMAIAVLLGFAMMYLVDPGQFVDEATQRQLVAEYGGAAQGVLERQAQQAEVTPMAVVDMFMPRNLFGAVTGEQRNALGEVLPLILFAILVGAAALRLSAQRRAGLQSGLEATTELMTGIVGFALKLAPYAVPAMVFSVIVKVGFDVLVALGVFVLGCVAVMLLHLFGTMSVWLRFLAKRSPLAFWKDVREVLITAFSTCSSSATLPTALKVTRERLGVSPSTTGFVLPLGATMNMSGTALYEGAVVLFVAEIFGVQLSGGEQVALLFLSVLGAVAVAGIPGGSLPIIAGLLLTFGIPPEGIGIVLGIDRILDMTRTMVNVGADVVTCAVIDRFDRDRAGDRAAA
ncbi:MAG: dicarboxylate/amino acid:cation symporter [Steroidobacteraceae bacterium]|jgi:DAACS family dicarboxylate/amino acid:cation (Na+ or H+) symporter|nr:dicarboxylate/amino acid:cation symporter [Steroidobacteraceae bacterium]